MIEQIAEALGLANLLGQTIKTTRTEFEAISGGHGPDDPAELRLRVAHLANQLADANLKLAAISEKLYEAKRAAEDVHEFREAFADYERVQLPGGSIVFGSKLHQGAAVPRHYICPVCAQNQKINFLQPAGRRLRCPYCGNDFDNEPGPKPGIVKINRGKWSNT